MNKIFILASVILMAFASQASYLYWQVVTDDIKDITYSGDSSMHVNIATLWAVDEVGNKVDLDSRNIDLSAPEAMRMSTTDLGNYLGDGYSYYVELANYNQSEGETGWQNRQVLAEGRTATYGDLLSGKYIQVDLDYLGQLWTGGPYNVPEPTSGLLILLGLASLALKRKAV